jgi:hypothetical protein
MTLAEEIRAEFARIRHRYEGISDALASIRVSTVERIEEYMDDAEEAKAHCTCEAARPAYRIPTERDTPAYRAMEQARIDRLLFAEQV